MPAVTVLGQISSGHGSFPPTAATAASGDVFVNGSGVVRVGDAYAAHGSPTPSPAHGRSASSGSGTVSVNGQPVHTIGDDIDCGGASAEGSPNVFVG